MIANQEESWRRYQSAVMALDARIFKPHGQRSREQLREAAVLRLNTLNRFLSFLGDPHQAVPVIHVTGTSGKGSTAAMIAAALTAAGYRTGLHTSPYLQSATEKLQINGALISANDFADSVEGIFASESEWVSEGEDLLTYGELFAALVFETFAKASLDVAVIEVGAGGRFDLTNVVQPEVSVITSVGLDHTEMLGDTLAEIAWHKAGIIKSGIPVVSAVVEPEASSVIAAEADRLGAELITMSRTTDDHLIAPGMGGDFQIDNAKTAIATLRALEHRGLMTLPSAIAKGMAVARLPGRAEQMQQQPPVLLDGAHNPQKVSALMSNLPQLLPGSNASTRVAVVGALASKDVEEMAALMAPHFWRMVISAPTVAGKTAAHVAVFAEALRHAGFAGQIDVEPNVTRAVEQSINSAAEIDGEVVITGSLYLAGEARERWFPTRSIVLQQTPWPT